MEKDMGKGGWYTETTVTSLDGSGSDDGKIGNARAWELKYTRKSDIVVVEEIEVDSTVEVVSSFSPAPPAPRPHGPG